MKLLTLSKTFILPAILSLFSACAFSADLTDILSPHFHLHGAIGYSSGEAEELASGHHAPTRKDGTIQGLEAGFSIRLEELIEGFYTHNLYYGVSKEWEDEMEEAFLKLKLMENALEIRGGRILSRIALLNNKHLHSWDTIDMPLSYSSFLGDDGLIINGGDITYTHGDINQLIFVAGFGEVNTHDCDEDSEHHHHHDPLLLDDKAITLSLISRIKPNDYHNFTTALWSAAGDNTTNEKSKIYGLSFQYDWYENGFTEKGQHLTISAELLKRSGDYLLSIDEEEHEHAEEHDHNDEDHEHAEESGDTSQYSFYLSTIYAPINNFNIGVRYEYFQEKEKIDSSGREKTILFSTFYFDEYHKYMTKIQYNNDYLKTAETREDSVWLQFGISLGGAEVR